MTDPADISATEPDWSRERIRYFWDAGAKLLRALRHYQAAKKRGGISGRIFAKYWVAVHRFWSLVAQSEIHLHLPIGGGLRLPHPTGIIIHQDCTIGPNCMIFHQVTLAGPCHIGGHVDIGAGAKIIGPVRIADHAVIGANAVVTKDVNAYEVVAGVPARVISKRSAS